VSTFCWLTRYEAEFGPQDRARSSDYDGKVDDMMERIGWDETHAMCALVEGHDGAHEFTPQGQITFSFASSEARQ
jgi:hypothetical protein